MTYTEKQPLLEKTKRISDDHEVSIRSYPFFQSTLGFINNLNPFQNCLSPLTKQLSNSLLEDNTSYYSDDDSELPDLPYVTDECPIYVSLSKYSQKQKLDEIRKLMRQYKIGTYIIPSEDAHQSEYTALADKRREYISGFTGSAGVVVITLTNEFNLTGDAILSTDGRYFLQAEKQLDDKYWKLFKQGSAGFKPWNEWAIESASKNAFSKVISTDPRLISVSVGEYFQNHARVTRNFEFKPLLQVNLVDQVWGEEQPPRSFDPVYYWDLKYSGEHTNDKLARVRQVMKENGSIYYLVSELDSIAWLFNLRSDTDIPFTPVFFSYALVGLEGVILYVNKRKIEEGDVKLTQYLSTIDNLTIKEYDEFFNDVSQLEPQSWKKITLPTRSSTTFALYDIIIKSFPKELIVHDSIIANLKIFKNKTELFNAKIAQYKDSLAFILFSSWLEDQLVNKQARISEYDAACKIYSIRKKLPHFKGLSYETISSTGANAAIIHYAPTKTENLIIDPTKIYLIDSGAHYLEGTTDITRTYKFGPHGLRDIDKLYYTLVLKGNLAVGMAKFPPNSRTTGTILDAFARQPLWNKGLDYNHGTGHGVASFGPVHEAPLYILTTSGGPSGGVFQPGAILTDEPGFYIDNEVGFRVESELEIVECHDSVGKTRGGENFLGFEYLTKVPFCRKLIDVKELLGVEIQWINEYHASIRRDFGDKLLELNEKKAYEWLINETEPL
ncbi:putative Xaa-Pro aminopeptidase P [Candida viswanathii]|uniref:Putative Xaa-Pro aminopeptidase P n=1 Tax=Candida viswanathii TaxID=5486 RepID=A0A367YAL9_9ASCO|nr:putative Xaa-Pro aminopeptidase P [Candida viswanathii]